MRARRRAPAPAPAPVAAAAATAGGAAAAAADAPAPAPDTAAASAAAAAPDAARPDHTRFDYMKHPDVVSAARRQRQLARQRSWEKFRACAKLAALRARASTWRERARRAAGCGELQKLLDEITLAYQRGHFKGKRTMFHFLQDMVHSVAAEPNKNQGRVSIHWHEVVLLSLLWRSRPSCTRRSRAR